MFIELDVGSVYSPSALQTCVTQTSIIPTVIVPVSSEGAWSGRLYWGKYVPASLRGKTDMSLIMRFGAGNEGNPVPKVAHTYVHVTTYDTTGAVVFTTGQSPIHQDITVGGATPNHTKITISAASWFPSSGVLVSIAIGRYKPHAHDTLEAIQYYPNSGDLAYYGGIVE